MVDGYDSRTAFPKYSEYFEKMVGGYDSRTAFPKYLEYFGKLVPTKNEATASSGLCPGCPNRFG